MSTVGSVTFSMDGMGLMEASGLAGGFTGLGEDQY